MTETDDAEPQPSPERLAAAYDLAAEEYHRWIPDMSADPPVNRALVTAFAELVAGTGNRRAVEAGCGTGRVTARLAELGLDIRGFDLSPGMVAVAGRQHPRLDFGVAPLHRLPVADGSLGGVVAWYSIIHTAPADLPAVFTEFRRVLAPGGFVLLASQAGTGTRRIRDFYRQDVRLNAYLTTPEALVEPLAATGFDEYARMVAPAPDAAGCAGMVMIARRR